MKPFKTNFRLAVFEDNPIVALGLSTYLSNIKTYGLEVVFSSSNPQEFLAQCHAQKPDFLIVDIISKDTFGLELFEQLLDQNKDEIILVYTNVKSRKIINTLLSMGIAAYIHKSDELRVFEDAFDALITKGTVYLPTYLEGVLDTKAMPIILTETEKKIIPYLLNGYSSKQIAEHLFVSTNAINFHKKNLFSKFEVNNMPSFVKEAIAQGYAQGLIF
ncbi:MAG: LuxR C-terminal-related transcriptional regulator [Flavobacteriales bacterium]